MVIKILITIYDSSNSNVANLTIYDFLCSRFWLFNIFLTLKLSFPFIVFKIEFCILKYKKNLYITFIFFFNFKFKFI